ncbi:hypothetical protein BGZ63DRAFT_123742 [Mariannaea sp. PMI_226]|nr:hypothetical protein BGZ63DRAFT_123742 [Mariannaea sp. PMI_226]
MKFGLGTIAATLALIAQGTFATTTPFCPTDGVCYSWGVPETAVKSGSGDVYFQVKASTSYQWAAVGIGSGMVGARIFLIYQDGDGNVTLSTRRGKGHIEPEYSEDKGLHLLDGSGVKNGEMIANIMCSDCTSLDFSGKNGWIGAWKKGKALNSKSRTEEITQHDDAQAFKVDFSTAAFTTSGNPFTAKSDSNDGSKSGSNSDSNSDSNNGSNSEPGSSDGVVTSGSTIDFNTFECAHGIIMSIVFVVLYPVGALLMPIIGNWMLHAGWQFIAFLAMWAGFGVGYVLAHDLDLFWANAHTKIGTIVVSLMGIQPILGWLHHQHFLKHRRRGIISYAHIWYGRALIIVGIINGGLGLQLANAKTGLIIAYSVVAGVIAIAYLSGNLFGMLRKKNSTKEPISP